MPIIWLILEGEGVRIDQTDIWIVEKVLAGGTAARLRRPDGGMIELQENIVHRVGPGFRIWLAPNAPAGHVHLAVEAYAPVMHRYPPRNRRSASQRGGTP